MLFREHSSRIQVHQNDVSLPDELLKVQPLTAPEHELQRGREERVNPPARRLKVAPLCLFICRSLQGQFGCEVEVSCAVLVLQNLLPLAYERWLGKAFSIRQGCLGVVQRPEHLWEVLANNRLVHRVFGRPEDTHRIHEMPFDAFAGRVVDYGIDVDHVPVLGNVVGVYNQNLFEIPFHTELQNLSHCRTIGSRVQETEATLCFVVLEVNDVFAHHGFEQFALALVGSTKNVEVTLAVVVGVGG